MVGQFATTLAELSGLPSGSLVFYDILSLGGIAGRAQAVPAD
jgi:hypothetical protein